MTRDEFLTWADVPPARYEFDGFEPVAITGGTRDHSQICQNIYAALRLRLKGTGCSPLGPDAGVATIGDAVRYPDALVTCTKGPGADRLVPGVVVVFEVLSPSPGRIDRIEKLLEYRAVPTIRRYVILEHASAVMIVYARSNGEAPWTATALTGGEVLSMPELGPKPGVSIPVAEFYDGTEAAENQSAFRLTRNGWRALSYRFGEQLYQPDLPLRLMLL
jgi:Uma2 family endonuclease